MRILPEAYKNIIVGLRWREKFAWYVSLKDIWFLDQTELEREYEQWCKKKGLPLNFAVSEDDERYGIFVLNEENINLFLPRIAKYAVSSDELREYMKLAMNIKSRDEVTLEYMPSLYIDFDKKILYSMYTEPASFEDYVPATWKGYYQNFLNLIEQNEKFWCEDGKKIIDF